SSMAAASEIRIGSIIPAERCMVEAVEWLDELRAVPAQVPPPPGAMDEYLDKVRRSAYSITDADVEAVRVAGVSEDEIFEQTVAAAIGQGFRRLDAGLEAL